MANNSAENKFHKYLIVGMCNHGMPKSRHSVGIQVLDRLATDLDLKWTRDKNCAGFTATFDLNEGAQVIMLKPKQFMNVNGKSVGKTVRQHNIDADKVYLMHDDLDRALGKVSIKEGGSAGGHNGIKSVQSLLGSAVNKMFKVRIGIDRPSSKDEVVEYVLTNFTQEEMTGVQEGVAKALQLWTWHLEGQGENVLLLTNLYGINPKITQSLNRKKKKEKIKSKDTVLSDKTDIGISTTSRTHLEKGVVSTDKHLDTTSISGRQRVESVSSADKQQDRISRTHSEDGEVTVDMEVKRTKGE
ncbi:peptidyl-tRNA hydrolase [Mizuhopecten yessoensis]|uniref:peptidyl-tRNA hydrolase n=2 Tax=Mizuhopecten yessoensis TaxID=6573 RepID=A0A210R129_MIZYE|nr:peptidyl-tRNA hydrolase [Mizuhopecten yessoensis]